jgi:hypothetical protein
MKTELKEAFFDLLNYAMFAFLGLIGAAIAAIIFCIFIVIFS